MLSFIRSPQFIPLNRRVSIELSCDNAFNYTPLRHLFELQAKNSSMWPRLTKLGKELASSINDVKCANAIVAQLRYEVIFLS